MEYLVIAALVVLLFVVVYWRLRPYIQIIQKALSVIRGSVGPLPTESMPRKTQRAVENKLIRCDSCGTWVPADRALKLSAGLAAYCSRECLEKSADAKERKLAG